MIILSVYGRIDKKATERMTEMNENGYENNPFEDENDYLFAMVTRNGRRKTYGWSVASMISGVLSVICCCTGYSGIVLGLLAIVFAIISRRNLGYFDGMSISGLALGIIGFILGLALVIAMYTMDEEVFRQYIEEFLKEYENSLDPDNSGYDM